MDDESRSCTPAVISNRIAIINKDFPSGRLSLDDADNIRREILALIDSIPVGERLPKILDNNLVKGALILYCADDATVEWIRSNFDCNSNNNVLSDLALRVIYADELPKNVKVAFLTKDKFSNPNTFLRRLQRFNSKLKCIEWKVLQFTAEPSYGKWILMVDSEDVQDICKAKYSAFTGLDRGFFEVLHDPNRSSEDKEAPTSLASSQEEDPLKQLKGQKMKKCRICREDHWASRCPYKGKLGTLPDLLKEEPKPIEDKLKAGKYVPPSKREGADRKGESMTPSRTRGKTATVRVTNLSKDVRDSDLKELFRPFGTIARIYLAKDKSTRQPKGFAFISYHRLEDATRAIQAVDGFRYDDLILSVEWAKPKNKTSETLGKSETESS